MAKYRTVTALYEDRMLAERAVARLAEAGFPDEDVSILMSESTHGREFGVHSESKAPEGAVAGVMAGGVIGAVTAGVAAVGTITVPGFGVVAAGWIVAALVGAGMGAAAGGLVGALIGLGIPEHEAKFYTRELEQGGVLVGVRATTSEMIENAEAVFRETGGKNIYS